MLFNDLALFTAVARHLSFSDAADQLSVPLNRVSRRVADLEEHLGIKLFERTTRHVRLTEEGRRLLDRCQEPIEALQDITGFAGDTKRHTIRITAPPLAARTTVGPRLLEFAAQNPNILLDLTTTNTMLDFFQDNIDLAFRLGPLTDSSLIARHLWPVDYCFCAGIDFINDNDLPAQVPLDQLLNIPAIIARQPWLLDGGTQVKPRCVVHEFDDLEVVAAAARRNMGIAMLPQDLVGGTLSPLTVEDAVPLQRHMFAVYPGRRLLPVRVRKLIDFMCSS